MRYLKSFNESKSKDLLDKVKNYIIEVIDKRFTVKIGDDFGDIYPIVIKPPTDEYYYWSDISDDILTLVEMLMLDYRFINANIVIWPGFSFKVNDIKQLNDMNSIFVSRGISNPDEHNIYSICIKIKES